jgi:hypothetical protein
MADKKSNFKGVAHTKESKECLVCGRLFFNNKSYASRGIWDEVKYCSDRCRRNKNKVKETGIKLIPAKKI